MYKSKLTSNIVYLYFLSVAQMIFPLLTFPYLTHCLSVDAYGIVSYIRATSMYLQLFIDFGFGLSAVKDIAQSNGDKERIGIITGNVIVAKLILAGTSFFLFIFLCNTVPILQHNKLFSALSFVVVVLSIFLLDFFFRGTEEMQLISLRFIIMKGISTALTFFMVKDDQDILWIPALDIISSCFAIIFVRYEIKRYNITLIFSSFGDVLNTIKESFIYFLSNMATTAFNILNTMLIGIYILDSKDIAYWSVAMTMVGVAQSLYNPIINGAYPQMAKKPSYHIISKLLKIFMPLVVIGCIFTFFFASRIISIINGPNYETAAYLLKLLIPVLFFSFPAMLLGWPALGAINEASRVTFSTIVSSMIQIIGLALLIIVHNFTLTAVALLRGFTEFILFLIRLCYFILYKDKFCD